MTGTASTHAADPTRGSGARAGAFVLAALVALVVAVVLAPPAGAQDEFVPQCSDGVDNDADGLTDFPSDPECVQGPDDPDGLSSDDSEAESGHQAFGGAPPDGGAPPGDGFSPGPCATTKGPATISNVFAKPAGGGWQPYQGTCLIEYQEVPSPTGGTDSHLLVSFATQNGDQNLAALYPQGTEISFDVNSSGPAPLFVLGTGRDMLADVGGQSMTVQGEVPRVEFAFGFGPDGSVNCAGGTQQMDFYGVSVMFPSTGVGQLSELMNSYAGAVIGTNAQSISFGGIGADGSIDAQIDGCGAELFYEATLPIGGLSLGGLSSSLANALASDLGDQGAGQANLTELADNSQQVPKQQFDSEFLSKSQLEPQPIPGALARRAASPIAEQAGKGKKTKVGAVGIDYRTGFSPHDISAAPNKQAVKKAKKAVKKCKKGKLKAKKSGKLVCKKKKGR